MESNRRHGISLLYSFGYFGVAITAAAIVFTMTLALTSSAQGQTYTVLHTFTGGLDGGNPFGGLTADAAGNLYGSTCGLPCVGSGNYLGSVFRLTKKGNGWVFTTLYIFRGGDDGAGPSGDVVIGPDGSLFGTTYEGGGYGCGGAGCGTVFNLKPPPSVPPSIFGGWQETALYRFQGGDDGSFPELGDLVFDQAGNLYGTTAAGGGVDAGTVFQLSHAANGWSEKVLYRFTGEHDGSEPLGTLASDGRGGFYGTTFLGGNAYCNFGPCGTVFQLSPSGSGWAKTILYNFQGGTDGGNPISGLLKDYGALVATTTIAGAHGGGTALMLNNDIFRYGFSGTDGNSFAGPWSTLAGHATGLYGTTYADGYYHQGSVFNLEGCAGWGYASLHEFTGGADGGYPASATFIDANGNLFGTTTRGGAYGLGVIFEITPAAGSLCNRQMNHPASR